MAQGKAYTQEEKEMIIESLKPFLEAGLSRNKACESIGFDPTTLSKWAVDSEALSMKLRGWENTLNLLAMANVAEALRIESESEDARKETSKWYLERRMKDHFSIKVEQEHSNPDGNLKTIVINKTNAINDKPSS